MENEVNITEKPPVILVNDDTIGEFVNVDTGVVLVDFYADWCGPCRMVGPVIENIAKLYEGKLPVFKMDVDSSPNTSRQLNIRSIPTVIVFKDGREFQRIVGASLQPVYVDAIENALK